MNKFGSVNEVAIKRLHSTSSQGANEFEAEVKILSKVRHGNLVPLIGYCSEGKEMILAYEFMPNGTLEDHLHRGVTELSWLQRLNICIGAARGLHYLHTGTSTQHGVIHRDVKSSNILLDSDFAAKISDFGMAKVGKINQTRTHVSTLVKGTFGYMDPCYYQSGKLTRKSDVYAFGVVLFEVLSGKQAVDPTLDEDQWSLAVWAQDHFKEGRLNGIIDHKLIGQISKKCLKEFSGIAIRCLHDQPKRRPTMAEVVVKLESILSLDRKSVGSGVDDGRFLNKVRYFFIGKADLKPVHAEENKADSMPARADVKLTTPHLATQKLTYREIRAFRFAELVRAKNKWNYHKFSTESGVGLAMYVRERYIGTSKLDLKPEEVNHPNLVKLLGYWLDKQVQSCVYEEIRDPTLDQLLFGEPGTTSLFWVARLKIAAGAAQGLSFLHKKGQPAYTQSKTDCIMVDTDYNARLWDFEIDSSFLALESYPFETGAHYAAPEWYRYQADVILEGIEVEDHLKEVMFRFETGFMVIGIGVKAEIYSFGVVLLEMLTGMKVFDPKRPESKQNLVKWATPLLRHEANLGMTMDPKLQDNNNHNNNNNNLPKGAFLFAQLVLNSLLPREESRPSMGEISQGLE